ncbi:MAG TPA: hypothetical protein PK878_15450 [bacterium]|nr:hypothetical protein [bacterium]
MELVSPIPDGAPPPFTQFKNYSSPSTVWKYFNAEGLPVFYPVWFDRPDGGKEVVPQTLWRNPTTGELQWRWKAHPEPWPLYNRHWLKAYPDRPVVVVEGEKAADAAAALFPDHIITTSFGGCLAAGKTDWTPLTGRDLTIWPDADDSGVKYAQDVARRAHEAGAASITILPILDGKPSGWDAADALAEGWTPEQAGDYLAAARPWFPLPGNNPAGAGTAQADSDEDLAPNSDPWPAPLDEAAFQGLAGEFVRMVGPHTESDPAALLIQFLVCFGNVAGRNPHWIVNATKHHMNMFVNLVGRTARSRKGTSLDIVLNLFARIDPDWQKKCVTNGLSSGEGLKFSVRDDTIVKGELVEGVCDKRLLVLESEFANVLKVINREGNTLSPTIRQAWDTGNLRNLTKRDPITATGAHISIIGHITRDELLKRMRETESANGFANRFLWFALRRSKLLPRGGSGLNQSALNSIVMRLHEALEAAHNVGEMDMTEAAWTIWENGIYQILSRDIPGLFGMVTARAEAQVRRLACLYALLDHSGTVDVPHLESALAVWRYAEDSARYIFGDATNNRAADTIMAHLRQAPDGLTRKEIIENVFQRNKSSEEIAQALHLLEEAGMARKEKILTGGKPAEKWYEVRA